MARDSQAALVALNRFGFGTRRSFGRSSQCGVRSARFRQGGSRPAYELLIAAGRLLAQIPNDPARYLRGLNTLGQPLWSPAGPNGFPDTGAAWASPEGIKLRLNISAQIASRLADGVDLLELVAADAASVETRCGHRALVLCRGLATADHR